MRICNASLLVLLLALIAAVPRSQAQQLDLIANTDARQIISLDGQWKTIIDPYESGYYDYRYQPSTNGYFKDAKPKTKTDLIEYDFDTSESLTVPGDWNSQKDRLFLYEGTIWYKKSFAYKPKPGTRVFVYFGAANYLADVYLNGQKLGRHEGGFTPFNFEITSLVRPKDNFLVNCKQPGLGNCPEDAGPDHDFGSSPILRTLPNGKQILLAGQKSAVIYALDPDKGGKILWQARLGAGGALGGIEWGFAADERNVYVPVADTTGPERKPGITALQISTGKQLWHVPAPAANCSWGQVRCNNSQSAAATLIPGVIFSGTVDGHLRAYSIKDGTIIWDVDTALPIVTVNGGLTNGGALDGGGPTIANGVVYTNSGYGRIVGQPGNLLLAFTVDGK